MRNDKVNIGRVTRLNMLSPVLCASETQMVTASLQTPTQLLVSILQATAASNGVTPWQSAEIDGSTSLVALSAPSFNAPTPPITPGTWVLRCRLRWGIGGASTVALFDYPVAGGKFCVTASELSLDALWFNSITGLGGTPEFGSPLDVLTIGSFISDGWSPVDAPVRLREAAIGLNAAATAVWAIKSHAVTCNISSQTEQITTLAIQFVLRDGTAQTTRLVPGTAVDLIDVTVDVPPNCVALRVTNRGAIQMGIFVSWQMGFS